jgi:hypothetical protein
MNRVIRTPRAKINLPKAYSPRPTVTRINRNKNIEVCKIPIIIEPPIKPVINLSNTDNIVKLFKLAKDIYEQEFKTDGTKFSQAFKVFVIKHPNLSEETYIKMINYFIDFLYRKQLDFEDAIIEFSILGTELISQKNVTFDDLYGLYF